ncbi:hypothetical protein AXE80_06265 [Wenyingzhuangia fucanilytica]|uniref:PepSY domain-containing protein n=1 Tax=Wenyingzhuangia fucanilytica TaxID=1790137 RepID=A0A1B1Y549_9FLAO|nr:hypothetical protein [Wenyingzhuangia fucanilytica]ANW95905.1 hypothetical protein AXE80_06265 [Wenyingzhuangia fucanilytica]
MKATKFLLLLTLVGFLTSNKVNAQDGIPTEVTSIVKMDLEKGQEKLSDLGYEICGSSLFGKKQDWYNESTKNCITIKFDKKKVITEVLPNSEVTKCQKAIEASHKIWEKYHDGQAPVDAAKINEERKKLSDKGFKVSYWVDQISPGNSSEYWVNEDTKKVMLIVWKVDGNKWLMTNKTDYEYGKNPALKH